MQLAELAKERSGTLLATKAKSRVVSREKGSYGSDIDESDVGDPNLDLGSLQSLFGIHVCMSKGSQADLRWQPATNAMRRQILSTCIAKIVDTTDSIRKQAAWTINQWPAEEAERVAKRARRHGTSAVLDALQRAEDRSEEQSGRATHLIIGCRDANAQMSRPRTRHTFCGLMKTMKIADASMRSRHRCQTLCCTLHVMHRLCCQLASNEKHLGMLCLEWPDNHWDVGASCHFLNGAVITGKRVTRLKRGATESSKGPSVISVGSPPVPEQIREAATERLSAALAGASADGSMDDAALHSAAKVNPDNLLSRKSHWSLSKSHSAQLPALWQQSCGGASRLTRYMQLSGISWIVAITAFNLWRCIDCTHSCQAVNRLPLFFVLSAAITQSFAALAGPMQKPRTVIESAGSQV